MVAYSFRKQFTPLIKSGLKEQTIRADRARHARRGEWIQLYQNQRHPGCFKIIPDPLCTGVLPLRVDFDNQRIWDIVVGDVPVLNIATFAALDGFRDPDEMLRFFVGNHKDALKRGFFKGVVIEWCSRARAQEAVRAT